MPVPVNNFTNVWATWINFSWKYYIGSCNGVIVMFFQFYQMLILQFWDYVLLYIYIFGVCMDVQTSCSRSNRSARKTYVICPKLARKALEWRQWSCSGVFIVILGHILLLFLLQTLSCSICLLQRIHNVKFFLCKETV